MSLGLSKRIEQMEEKKKKLFQNMISVFLMFLLFYCIYRFFESLYITGFNPVAAFMLFLHRDLAFVLIFTVFLLMANRILKGKGLPIPQNMLQNPQQTQQTQQPHQSYQSKQKPKFNIPDSYSTKRYKVKPDKKVKPRLMSQKSKVIGTWKCPTCRHLAIGSRCDRCGRRYSR